MAAPPQQPLQGDQPNTHEERHYRWANRISILALLISLVAAGFTYWQASLTKEANDITRRNNIVSQRAFVYPVFNQIVLATDPLDPGEVKGANFLYSITNSGNTPTKDLTFLFKCAPSAEDLQEPWSVLYQGPGQSEKSANFIGPHASAQAMCGFPFRQIQEIAAGTLFGYLMMDIRYKDRLDDATWHRTQMALRFSQISITTKLETFILPGGGSKQAPNTLIQASLLTRGKHNCTDEECPDN